MDVQTKKDSTHLELDDDSTFDAVLPLKESGALVKVLQQFQRSGIGLTHIESRPSRRVEGEYEFLISGRGKDSKGTRETIKNLGGDLVRVSGSRIESNAGEAAAESSEPFDGSVTAFRFPRTIQDLDQFANRVLDYISDLPPDHPGFSDAAYRARRKEMTNIATNYKHGQSIPRIEYTEKEVQTWGTVFRNLKKIFPTHACEEYNRVFPLLEEQCGFREDNIPQLEDVSQFLQKRTGWRLRPVAGFHAPREFLAGLAFRVFHATQFIRHWSKPLYTPEPDVCHELIGHVPMLADPKLAQFSQDIGLASLGAPDDWVEKLTTCWFYTMEFGVCRQEGQVKAYGAGLLSSFGELQYCLSDKPEMREFEPEKTGVQPYRNTEYQPLYYVAESFEDAKSKLQKFCDQIPRPFVAKYNPYTLEVEMLDNKDKILNHAAKLKDDFEILREAVSRLCA